MASDITIENLLPGVELLVQIEETSDNIFIVTDKKNSLKGLLIPVTKKNNVIFEQIVKECKELNSTNDSVPNSLSSICVPDSTLSNSNNNDTVSCDNCKSSFNKVPKLSKEVAKLTHHGFNNVVLKKKNNQSRRGMARNKTLKTDADMVVTDVDESISRPNCKRDALTRTLKTRANEKIIESCSKRKYLKLSGLAAEVSETVQRLSDVSVYDFMDEDCVAEESNVPVRRGRGRPRIYPKKTVPVDKNEGAVDGAGVEEDVTSCEHDGAVFAVNDVVWAKIPGYPSWPAHINGFDDDGRCRINWIGWDQTTYLPLKSLRHFRDHFAGKYSSRLTSAKYRGAIGLACKELGLDQAALEAEANVARSPETRGSESPVSRRRSIDLDEIFGGGGSGPCDVAVRRRRSCSDDEEDDDDTDEEEKARSALITVESLEANTKLSGLISRVD